MDDIELLSCAVAPWELFMSQLAAGQQTANLAAVNLQGILLTRSTWSHPVAATGLSPPGYVVISGPCTGRTFQWCGRSIGGQRAVFANDCLEMDFVVPEKEDHWTILLPVDFFPQHLGADWDLGLARKGAFITVDAERLHGLGLLVTNIIAGLTNHPPARIDALSQENLYNEILERVTGLLLHAMIDSDPTDGRRRWLAYRRALPRIMSERGAISADSLARECGVSRRTFELGFREYAGMSPQKFSRCIRINGLHRDLCHAKPDTAPVIELMSRWGFSEFGRTAGYYKELFRRTPSETLAQVKRSRVPSFADCLH